jgi:hypothetical protein
MDGMKKSYKTATTKAFIEPKEIKELILARFDGLYFGF